MSDHTTIQIHRDTVELLKQIKEYPTQTYNDLIQKMAHYFVAKKQNNQYDAFLHKIQQMKMQELWNNAEDEAWENVH